MEKKFVLADNVEVQGSVSLMNYQPAESDSITEKIKGSG